MASVNATRSGMARKMNDAVDGARLIGFDGKGLACVWYGGYSFNVYNAVNGWNEVRDFTSGDIAGMVDAERRSDYGTAVAIDRMKSEGFEVVTPE